jgi:hypothetical protein
MTNQNFYFQIKNKYFHLLTNKNMPNCPYCGKQFKRRNALNHHIRYSCKSKSNNNDDNNNNNNKRKRKSPIRTTYEANHIRSQATGKRWERKQGNQKRDLDQEKNDLETIENTIIVNVY